MATSEAKVLANRRNALRSTGPRTAAGKARVSRNRLRHGLTGVDPVLPEECVASFHLFEAEVNEHLDPRHPIEAMLAEQICSLLWRLRRIGRMEARIFELALERSPGLGGASTIDAAALQLADNPDHGLLTLSRYERSLRNSLVRALAEFRRVRAAHGDTQPARDGDPGPASNAANQTASSPAASGLLEPTAAEPAQTAQSPVPAAPEAAQADLTIQTQLPAVPSAPSAAQAEDRPALSDPAAPTRSSSHAGDQTQTGPDQSQPRLAERSLLCAIGAAAAQGAFPPTPCATGR